MANIFSQEVAGTFDKVVLTHTSLLETWYKIIPRFSSYSYPL